MSNEPTNTTLLIIEDDTLYRERLVTFFERRSIKVVAVASVQELTALLEDTAVLPSVTHAIIDLKLGDDSGLTALSELRQAFPACNAVMLSGMATIASTVAAMKLGAETFLTKPVTPTALLNELFPEQTSETIPRKEVTDPSVTPTLAQQEWEHINRVLHECEGNITHAAKALGIHRRSLQRKLAKIPGPLQ